MALRFRYEREQKVCEIGGVKVGGQPGENPPLLMASLFQKGDKLIESRKKRKFDRDGATERIREMERISDETCVPGIVTGFTEVKHPVHDGVDPRSGIEF